MRIYSMTATFGKLEHETLTLQPGLNIIEAPNEWGKSTWCAFLIAMLYGIETRVKTTKTALADKERYAPWSGSPMSGRMDLNWNGRDITIERSSKARQPMGVFRAYETETGLEIPELTADNCGQMLLGVERNVFTKAGFLRFTDLPVAQDEALRQRLNALVTTGDESGSAELLSQKLKDLKNKCYVNRTTGLLPAAEKQRQALQSKLDEYENLTIQSQRLRQRQSELEDWASQLENHKAALRYAAAREDARRLDESEAAKNDAAAEARAAEEACAGLPQREEAQKALAELESLRRTQDSLAMEEQMLPAMPQFPEIPEQFRGIQPEDAVSRAEADKQAWEALKAPEKPGILLPLLGAAGMVAAVVLLLFKLWPVAIGAAALGIGALIFSLIQKQQYRQSAESLSAQKEALSRRYGSDDPTQWVSMAMEYRSALAAYRAEMENCRRIRGNLDQRREALAGQLGDLAGRQARHQATIAAWDRLAEARRDLLRAEKHYETLKAMAKTAEPPAKEDHLTHSDAETLRLLADAAAELRQLHRQLGQYQGQAEALGDAELLKRELEQVDARIHRLERTYNALELAQKTLNEASAELQRRFAPRIARQAQALFTDLTGGRYRTLTLASDLSLHAAAEGEDTLHSHQWRSDGTVDQLYLALRLAVARELTPEAPLILDDALVRFDDTRLAAALTILRREAEDKQVILFTCHGRENAL